MQVSGSRVLAVLGRKWRKWDREVGGADLTCTAHCDQVLCNEHRYVTDIPYDALHPVGNSTWFFGSLMH